MLTKTLKLRLTEFGYHRGFVVSGFTKWKIDHDKGEVL